MSSIPTNIVGAIAQSQVSSSQNAKQADAKRNKRLNDSRELARLADQKTHEVENTDHAENLRVHREDEKERDGQDAHDANEQHKNSSAKLYCPDGKPADPDTQGDSSGQEKEHIDLSA